VTSELNSGSTTNRIWHIAVTYDAQHRPISATKSSLATSLAIDDPEGLVVLPISSAYGNSGELYTAEDAAPGRILHVTTSGAASSLAGSLQRPEGLAFGDFAGASASALYAAETSTHRIIRIDSDGSVSTFGTPTSVSLTFPDNVEFGPDGYLYISEDRPSPSSRLIRASSDGTHIVFATGFSQAQGLVFDPTNGDLYIAEQNLDRVWRVVFANATIGDYNHNGTVDAADYTVWSDTFGETGAALAADGNRDFQTDLNDQLIWKATFGHSNAIGAGGNEVATIPVPEPDSLLVFAIGTVVVVGIWTSKTA
jgi:sugar lactone lactonase YvrE